jgi:hypothetical protein
MAKDAAETTGLLKTNCGFLEFAPNSKEICSPLPN